MVNLRVRSLGTVHTNNHGPNGRNSNVAPAFQRKLTISRPDVHEPIGAPTRFSARTLGLKRHAIAGPIPRLPNQKTAPLPVPAQSLLPSPVCRADSHVFSGFALPSAVD